jgi:putative tricarboxylic transport membrane protein
VNSLRSCRAAFLAAALAAGASVCAQAPAWRPVKPVEIISPSSPGGSTDAMARTLQKLLQAGERDIPPLNVVNKSGGNQTVALAYMNQHAGDGHYVTVANATLNTNFITGISDLRYFDVTPIALLSSEYTVFTVAAASPLRRFADAAAQLKKAPESLPIGITTRGGTNHVVLCLAARALGVEIKQLKVVSFRSNAESMTALLGGHLQMVVSTVAASIEQVRGGNARFLAIGAPRRMAGTLANTPTLREEGINVAKPNWRAIVGAKRLDAAQIAWWEQALRRMSAGEAWKKSLDAEYWSDSFAAGGELTRFLENEFSEDKAVLADLGLAR